MSQKIISKIFDYAAGEDADHLVIAKRDGQLVLDCYFPGQKKRSLVLPKRLDQELFSALRKIAAIASGEFAAKKYCRLPYRSGCLNFYLTVLPEGNGERVIISPIKKHLTIWRLNRLGLQRPDLLEMKGVLGLNSGLILISSPDGQGKSATLNSLLLELNDSDKSAYFLIDRNTYEIPGVTVMEPTLSNWEKLLKIDSDIIFADSLDDPKSLDYAIQAAASGRLVLGAIKATDSFGCLEKVIDSPLPLKSKLDSLKMIVNQRLAAMKRKPRKNSHDQRREIGLFEILKISPALKKMLTEKRGEEFGAYEEALKQLADKEGFRPLSQDRLRKTKEGLI